MPHPSIIHPTMATTPLQQVFQNQPTTLQPKSLFSSPIHSSTQVFNGSPLKQISSQPQIITSQAPQLFGLQALNTSLSPGLSWATPGNWPQSSVFLAEHPIIFCNSQESNMFVQSQHQGAMHFPYAAPQPVPLPYKYKQIRVRPRTRTVATQTIVSSSAIVNSMTPPIHTQIMPKAPKLLTSAVVPTPIVPKLATSQTQSNQSPPQLASLVMPQSALPLTANQKSDAANQIQTNPFEQIPVFTYSRCISVGIKAKQPQLLFPKSQAMITPSTKIVQATVAPCIDMSAITSTSTVATLSSTTPVLQTSTVQVNTSISTVDVSPSMPILSPIQLELQTDTNEPPLECFGQLPTSPQSSKEPSTMMDISAETDYFKPQQPLTKQSLTSLKEKQLQKAIVKPQTLTHIMDDIVIQESPEPFPVRSAIINSPCHALPSEKVKSNEKRKESPLAVSSEKVKVRRGPGRPKKVCKGRKSLNKQLPVKQEEALVFATKENVADDESPTFSSKTEENTESLDVYTPPVLAGTESSMDIKKTKSLSFSQKSPTRWTVQDVFEFIRDTPGGADYAETFRSQEIDGQTLLMLNKDVLINAMSIKLGPAVKLISRLSCIKKELGVI